MDMAASEGLQYDQYCIPAWRHMLSRGASALHNRTHACLGLVLGRGFHWLFRLAGFLHRLLSVLAMLGLSMFAMLEQVPNVVSHVICQHGRMSRLRALQRTA